MSASRAGSCSSPPPGRKTASTPDDREPDGTAVVHAEALPSSEDRGPLLGLLDRQGRLWTWDATRPRHIGVAPGVFRHEDLVRTELEIEAEAEPLIEVRDPQLLRTRLEPVPAERLELNDLVVLPVRSELSPVIGLFACEECSGRSGRSGRCLFVCTENGDWAHRDLTFPVLRAASLASQGEVGSCPDGRHLTALPSPTLRQD